MGAAVSIMACARTTELSAGRRYAFATHRSVLEYAVHRTLTCPLSFLMGNRSHLVVRAGYHLNQVEPLRDIHILRPTPY